MANERDNMLRPANDIHFEIIALEEPEMGATYMVIEREWMIAPADEHWPCETLVLGEIVDQHITDNPYGIVEAFREHQAYTLEERIGEFGLEWQREQEERGRYS